MNIIEFEGLGTKWKICIDEEKTNNLQAVIKKKVDKFEQTYSRFIKSSYLSKLNQSKQGSITIPRDLQKMLELGLKLEQLTQGAFSLDIDKLMQAYGYDANYSFETNLQEIKNYKKTNFWLNKKKLFRETGVEFDLGSIGKGYLVDKIAIFFNKIGVLHYLISAGGDIFATSKKNGNPWKVAIEHPLEIDKALGIIELKNQALASSSSNKRKIGKFHHLLNSKTKKPASGLLTVSVLAKQAMIADGGATAIFVSSRKLCHQEIAKNLKIEYLTITEKKEIEKTKGFKIKGFT